MAAEKLLVHKWKPTRTHTHTTAMQSTIMKWVYGYDYCMINIFLSFSMSKSERETLCSALASSTLQLGFMPLFPLLVLFPFRLFLSLYVPYKCNPSKRTTSNFARKRECSHHNSVIPVCLFHLLGVFSLPVLVASKPRAAMGEQRNCLAFDTRRKYGSRPENVHPGHPADRSYPFANG